MRLGINKAVEILKPLLEEHKLVLFAGTGISVPAGAPTWDELLRQFVEFCTDLQQYLEPDEQFHELLEDARKNIDRYPTRVASVLKQRLVYLQEKRSQNIFRAFQNWLAGSFGDTPHENHKLIVSTNYPFILTSNYDLLLEKAAQIEGYGGLSMLNTFTFNDADKVAAALYQKTPSIFHVHGDIQSIAINDFVFTAEDYATIDRKYSGFTMALQTLFLSYSVLFVGYGGSDPHFEDFMEDISYNLRWSTNEKLPKAYLALRKDKIGEVLNKYKDRLRTDIIELDTYEQTTEFLGILQKIAPRPK